ncbi:hypothetical protein GGI11_004243 [Coemansia sp. RSA 2049]|nr:hypothetical protein GGI11_004243 [Coemansia sp. RSA 2049]
MQRDPGQGEPMEPLEPRDSNTVAGGNKTAAAVAAADRAEAEEVEVHMEAERDDVAAHEAGESALADGRDDRISAERHSAAAAAAEAEDEAGSEEQEHDCGSSLSAAVDDEDTHSDTPSQTFYDRPALFLRQQLPESAWEADDATAVCHQCSRRFTLFVRRHHCRRCGLVFCDTCSQRRILLAAPVTPTQGGYYMQRPPPPAVAAAAIQSDDDLPLAHSLYVGGARALCWRFREHRACDACARVVDRLPPASADSIALVAVDSESSGAIENAYNIFRDPGALSDDADASGTTHSLQQQNTSRGTGTAATGLPLLQRRRQQSSSSICVCPVCMRDWATVWAAMARVPGEGWQEAQERHIRDCIEDTSAEMQGGTRRRMRQTEDARRSRSVQGRGDDPSHHAAAGSVARDMAPQNRRSVGFLSFFDRTPPQGSSGLDAVHQALAAAQQSQQDQRRVGAAESLPNPRAARSPMGVRFVSYRLTGDTPLLGQECPICFEDFEPGQHVARLNCLCTYHQPCISEWLQRTPACPVHYE